MAKKNPSDIKVVGHVMAGDARMTETNKEWTKQYPAIEDVQAHTFEQEDGSVGANWDPLGEEHADDAARKELQAYPPNRRSWFLNTEQDMVVWFHTEVSNVVLAGWAAQPDVLQTSQGTPLHGNSAETADILYTVTTPDGKRIPWSSGR